ncbi:hypothetical protein GJ496_008627 [Pomphorhynchus laevis]|nr:hypothetical protein GJ496_008627 [Pomphorhynchus laevis]
MVRIDLKSLTSRRKDQLSRRGCRKSFRRRIECLIRENRRCGRNNQLFTCTASGWPMSSLLSRVSYNQCRPLIQTWLSHLLSDSELPYTSQRSSHSQSTGGFSKQHQAPSCSQNTQVASRSALITQQEASRRLRSRLNR